MSATRAEMDAFWARKIVLPIENTNACDPHYDRAQDPRYNENLPVKFVNINADGRYRGEWVRFGVHHNGKCSRVMKTHLDWLSKEITELAASRIERRGHSQMF